ncbi:hypothetical protein FZW96_07455 [Bacillus sp. BGMRC 2118]|nr:hypothetical protein FZW96_07455 [Bacillus sp. BGMRC 2118]
MKIIFHYLALLNLIDGIVSYVGLHLEEMEEANVLMLFLYEMSPLAFLGVKLLFSLALYCFILLNVIPPTKIIKGLTSVAATLYTYVMFLHIFWLSH